MSASPPPTLVLFGGRVLADAESGGFAEAVAMSGDRITAVGGSREIRDTASASTRLIDLRGRLAIPAFGDAHVHPTGGGIESLQCDLTGERSRKGYLDRVAEHAARAPEGAWVVGGGWSMESFPGGLPVGADLDGPAGGRPVFLVNRDHHSGWASPAALRLAGIDRETPDPGDGRIERDASGEPTGALHEGAMSLVQRILPRLDAAQVRAGLLAGQARLHSVGITHWQDAIVGGVAEIGVADAYGAYSAASEDGSLTGSVVGALWWDRHRGLEQIDELLSRREGAASAGFKATSVKIMVDGVCETLTAAMTEPYSRPAGASSGAPQDSSSHGTDGAHRGELFIDPELLTAAVAALDAYGFQVHFHVIGDRAASVALDALAALPAGRVERARHHLAHLQFIRPEDVGRIGALGAVANFQPLWACRDPQMEELTNPVVGPERERWQYRIGSVWRSGGRVAF
ncbi:MAG TPA: amidohydrolase family protein, partial [Acidimicrobiales bacterium]|nr:amidohydrolase family protein [Acidimicrobiales bacterium]